jgi:ABC-3C biological conflict system middle component
MTDSRNSNPFNSAFEAGLRSVVILVEAFPKVFDLQNLVTLDYLTVHSKDADGPPSLHPPVPLRSGELLIRRRLIERGLLLMVSRGLLSREFTLSGITFGAAEAAAPFLNALSSKYVIALRERAKWSVDVFAALSAEEFRERSSKLLTQWNSEFEANNVPGAGFQLL